MSGQEQLIAVIGRPKLTGLDGESPVLTYGPLIPILLAFGFAGFDARASADTFSNAAGNGLGGGGGGGW